MNYSLDIGETFSSLCQRIDSAEVSQKKKKEKKVTAEIIFVFVSDVTYCPIFRHVKWFFVKDTVTIVIRAPTFFLKYLNTLPRIILVPLSTRYSTEYVVSFFHRNRNKVQLSTEEIYKEFTILSSGVLFVQRNLNGKPSENDTSPKTIEKSLGTDDVSYPFPRMTPSSLPPAT